MKVYHSLWYKPLYDSDSNGFLSGNQKFNGGWYNSEIFFLAWAFSFYKLRELYGNVTFIGDKKSKFVIIDQLGLEYDEYEISLEEVESKYSKIWAIGKIYTYRNVPKPFLHFDGDVFIWEKIRPFSAARELIFQNYEYNESYYKESLFEINEKLDFIPKEFKNKHKSSKIISINAGVFGCNSYDFIEEYTDKVLEFISRNSHCLQLVDQGRLNTVYEQYLCYLLAKKNGIKMTPIHKVSKTNNNFNLNKFTDFYKVPSSIKYIHPLGFKKRLEIIGVHIHARFNYEFHQEYQLINSRIKAFMKNESKFF